MVIGSAAFVLSVQYHDMDLCTRADRYVELEFLSIVYVFHCCLALGSKLLSGLCPEISSARIFMLLLPCLH